MNYRVFALVVGCLAWGTAASQALAEGDAVVGNSQFDQKCATCHSDKPGVKKIGPSLFGVVGRKAASLPDYDYSPALRAYKVTWTAETLKPYIRDPQDTVPGVRMTFPGEKNEATIDDIIAYLATLH